jgi:hypothetical protein
MITSLTSGASIRYTTDGSTPSEITGTLYEGPVTLNGTNAVTLNAIAYHDGMTDSAVTRGIYTFTSNISATNVYEAENGVIVSPAQIYTDSHASGGEFVGDFNVGGSDTFTNVDGGSGRTASLVVSYTADSNKRATLYVNGTNMGKIYWGPGTYDNTNWRLQVVTNSFTLNPGPVNRIEISQDPDDSGSWVCADIDKITVIVSK